MEKKRILVVDDEPDTLTFMATVLEDAGYEIERAEDGEKALAALQERRPDLITLDITMPKRSGVRFYRDVKESDVWSSIPVVIVTGISGEFEGFISGRRQVPTPEGYLSKPVEPADLVRTVRELLGDQ